MLSFVTQWNCRYERFCCLFNLPNLNRCQTNNHSLFKKVNWFFCRLFFKSTNFCRIYYAFVSNFIFKYFGKSDEVTVWSWLDIKEASVLHRICILSPLTNINNTSYFIGCFIVIAFTRLYEIVFWHKTYIIIDVSEMFIYEKHTMAQ